LADVLDVHEAGVIHFTALFRNSSPILHKDLIPRNNTNHTPSASNLYLTDPTIAHDYERHTLILTLNLHSMQEVFPPIISLGLGRSDWATVHRYFPCNKIFIPRDGIASVFPEPRDRHEHIKIGLTCCLRAFCPCWGRSVVWKL
jgi:hypothetical protein